MSTPTRWGYLAPVNRRPGTTAHILGEGGWTTRCGIEIWDGQPLVGWHPEDATPEQRARVATLPRCKRCAPTETVHTLRAAIARVRHLHRPAGRTRTCRACGETLPCMTLAALDPEETR